ncbi:serine hydrolase domain-containing protein [Kitasatospora kazusensis]|uniref:Serine hydrolase domain-containing protein n=2 Tax=Kitasatospora kazusensis TaxID=407974 RepID=A0ABN2YYG2_9ACTN
MVVVLCTVLGSAGVSAGASAGVSAAEPAHGQSIVRAATAQAVADGYLGSIAYVRQGEVAASAAAGFADVRTRQPASPDDRFRIASNTKSFVAAVALQLVGEHRLSLDDSVEKWLPGVVQGSGNDGSGITVRQLLDQTSGIYDPTTEPAFFAPYLEQHDRDYVYTPRQVVAAAVAHPPLFAPGERWAYSNTNYLLAGLVIEAVTGQSVAAQIRSRILLPLGLTRTSFPLTDPQIHGRHLHGYDLAGQDVTRFSPSYDWAAGAMISTLDDLARFDRALFGGRLLHPAEQRELETVPQVPDADGYALGVQRWEATCSDGRKVPAWETDGGGPGYTSISLTAADGSRQFILVGNVFDLAKDLQHQQPNPKSSVLGPAQTAVFCG